MVIILSPSVLQWVSVPLNLESQGWGATEAFLNTPLSPLVACNEASGRVKFDDSQPLEVEQTTERCSLGSTG